MQNSGKDLLSFLVESFVSLAQHLSREKRHQCSAGILGFRGSLGSVWRKITLKLDKMIKLL